MDDEIDRLYQLPLDEFTSARNALAKTSGGKAAEIKLLEKPNTAAWAINQVFWRQRPLYDKVIAAAGARRDAYRMMLAGKTSDVAGADAAHRAAIKAAAQAAREQLEKSGGKPTDQVMTAIGETLDALPAAEAPGRLTKSLKRIGFDGLEGVPVAAAPKKVTPIVPRAATTDVAKGSAAKERQVAEEKQRKIAMVRERLRFAQAAERESLEALERAARTVERAERTRDRIAEELAEASDAAKNARKEEAAAQTAYDKAVSERKQLEKQLP
jgi:hypothetical protein